VLRHMAGAELQRGPHADRLAALASHLLGQRRCVRRAGVHRRVGWRGLLPRPHCTGSSSLGTAGAYSLLLLLAAAHPGSRVALHSRRVMI
jgi:hypothetical protein